ncbi:response regulator [Cerasicoccus fimbriatus]|uniref:response regulator n=1 Tax=Cerasicoccus fimbriatus TaxID=3014554 RepID=UPI0022B4142D|nr:response regulator transcription factor [Cerasicoccus sp. TK19100]
MKTLYIIEDNDMLKTLLERFITSEMPDMELLGISADGSEAMQKCLELKPDLVVADVGIPEVNGLEILHLLKMKIPETKIIIYTGRVTPETIRLANHGHADGFVSKASGIGELAKAIQAIADGETFYFSEDVLNKIQE